MLRQRFRFAKDETRHYPLAGGLDLMTPAISVAPGRASDAQNYEPEISGGYRRIDGYERFDGRASPSSIAYWIAPMNRNAAVVNVGDVVTGGTSGAIGKVLAALATYLVLARVSGTFTVGETLSNGATIGTLTSAVLQNGAGTPSLNADYALLAANDWRQDIGAVPGSGLMRGVWVYKDTVYAFRDSADGTEGRMYKATPTGWQQVVFGYEIQFNAGASQINAGDVIANAASGATSTCTVLKVLSRNQLWDGTGVGSLIVTAPTGGGFASGSGIYVGSTQKATAAAASGQIKRAPGGHVECVTENFTGSLDTKKMYGADGVNTAFEFDGTNYIPIHTGMATDTPSHIIGHQNYLFLSFLGSVQYSGIGNPYAWTVTLGAGEIATGEFVTGFLPAAGSSQGDSSLAIFTKGRTFILYGASNASFKLVKSKGDIGFSTATMQPVTNDLYGLTARGIHALVTTLDYGDFDYDSISHQIQPFMTAKMGLETVSTTLHAKNQYRLFFNDGTGLVVGLTGDKVSGLLPLNYGKAVRCICTALLSSGQEVTYFGDDDGYVYRDCIGTSFDGQPIESWLRLHFNNLQSPLMRKRMRRAVLEAKVDSYTELSISYDLGYGSPDVQPSAPAPVVPLTGAGGYWDSATWDQFNWDVQVVLNPIFPLEGTEKNISFIFYSNRAQDSSHTLQGITFVSSPRRQER